MFIFYFYSIDKFVLEIQISSFEILWQAFGWLAHIDWVWLICIDQGKTNVILGKWCTVYTVV